MASSYVVGELLGKGSYGSVYRATHKENGKAYAIKVIGMSHHMSAYTKLCVLNELRLLATHVCPYIVVFKEAYVRTQSLCLVTEFASNGDLQRLIKTHASKRERLRETDVWHLFLQTCIGVDYLHKLNVIHRDLKPANVLIDAHNNIKVADLGIAKILRSEGFGHTQIGTPLYMSPEILRRERYGPKSDAWALGCILFELLHLRPAFYASSVYLLRNHILAGQFVKRHVHFSPQLNDVITSLLRVPLRGRWSVDAVLSRPDVALQMQDRGLERSKHDPEVRPLFYKACAPPSRIEDWKVVADMFCDLNHTIRLSDTSERRVALIHQLRSQLERKKTPAKPPSTPLTRMTPRVPTPSSARVLPAKILAEIDEYERKVVLLHKQVQYYQKLIHRLKQGLVGGR